MLVEAPIALKYNWVRIEVAPLAVQVHSNGQSQIRQVVVRSVGGGVKVCVRGNTWKLVRSFIKLAPKPKNQYEYIEFEYNIENIVTRSY